MKRALQILALTLATLLLSGAARADQIALTGGSFDILVGGSNLGPVQLVGDRGFTFDGLFRGVVDAWGIPLPPGSPLAINAQAVGTDLPGTATLDGVTYEDVGGLSSDSSGWLTLKTDPVLLPSVLNPPSQVQAPFTLDLLFTGGGVHTLTGSGTATIFLGEDKGFDVPSWRVTRITGELAGSPVPEPATLTLLGTGLASIAVRRRSARRSARGAGL